MNHQVLPFVFALILALVWAYLSSRLLLRSPDGKISWSPINRRGKEPIGFEAHFGFGMLGIGVGLFILDLADRYIRWKLYGNPSDQPQLQNVIELLYSSLLGGAIFGLLMALQDSTFGRKRTTRQ